MNEVTGVGEPASELEHLIADLSESGPLVFVFGDGCLLRLRVGWAQAAGSRRVPRSTRDSSRLP